MHKMVRNDAVETEEEEEEEAKAEEENKEWKDCCRRRLP